MAAPKKVDITIAAGTAFRLAWRVCVGTTANYYVVNSAVAEIFDGYTDKVSLLRLTTDVTDGATGWVYFTATAVATAALTDPGGGENLRKVSRWAEWQAEVNVTYDGVTEDLKFYGQVDLVRDLNPQAPA